MDKNEVQEIVDYLGHPIEKVVNQWSMMQTYLLDMADEALALQGVIA